MAANFKGDVYRDEHFIRHFITLCGRHVSVILRTGQRINGVLRTVSEQFELVLSLARISDLTNEEEEEEFRESLVLSHSDVVCMSVVDISVAGNKKLLTDSDIASKKSKTPNRELQEFNDFSEDGSLSGVNLSLDEGLGWDSQEMLSENEQRFGYKSTYSSELPGYTTKLEGKDTPEFLARLAKADRIASEIESKAKHGSLRSEEDTFSAVLRPPQPLLAQVLPTSQPTESSTSQPSLSSTSQPTESSTSQPSLSSTSQPTESSTGQPPLFSTSQPTESSTGQPTESSTGQPSLSSTSQPLESSTSQPTESSTDQPLESSTGQPTESSTGQPSLFSTSQPTESSTGQPSLSSTSQPLESSTSQPLQSSTDQPLQSSTDQPLESSTSQVQTGASGSDDIVQKVKKFTFNPEAKSFTPRQTTHPVSPTQPAQPTMGTPYHYSQGQQRVRKHRGESTSMQVHAFRTSPSAMVQLVSAPPTGGITVPTPRVSVATTTQPIFAANPLQQHQGMHVVYVPPTGQSPFVLQQPAGHAGVPVVAGNLVHQPVNYVMAPPPHNPMGFTPRH